MENRIFVIVLLAGMLFQSWACRRNDMPPAGQVYRLHESMTVDGRERTYLLNLPPTYYAGANFSLVIALHGGGGNAGQFETTSKLSDKARAAPFMVVYPEGVKSAGPLGIRSWNAGGCCAYARDAGIDDVKFIRQLIDKLVAGYKVNPKKVYATGHSNGGMLAYRLACEIPDKIAAIAPNACTMVAPGCQPSRPVPVLHMHAAPDTSIPYQGGAGSGIGTAGVYLPAIDSVLNAWAAHNGCATPAWLVVNNPGYTLTRWSDCREQGTIDYYLTQDGGHGWPGGLPGGPNSDKPSAVINANNLLWDFFRQYQLP